MASAFSEGIWERNLGGMVRACAGHGCCEAGKHALLLVWHFLHSGLHPVFSSTVIAAPVFVAPGYKDYLWQGYKQQHDAPSLFTAMSFVLGMKQIWWNSHFKPTLTVCSQCQLWGSVSCSVRKWRGDLFPCYFLISNIIMSGVKGLRVSLPETFYVAFDSIMRLRTERDQSLGVLSPQGFVSLPHHW